MISEQEHTIRNLSSDTRKAHQLIARGFYRQGTQRLQFYFVPRDHLCAGEQVRGAEPHFTRSQVMFRERRETFRRGKSVTRARRSWNGIAKPFANELHDLLNLDDLFGRRKNEGSETFPR